MTHPGNSATRFVSPVLHLTRSARLGLFLGAALLSGGGAAWAASPLDLPGGCVVALPGVEGDR